MIGTNTIRQNICMWCRMLYSRACEMAGAFDCTSVRLVEMR